jgi:hypothetical protein
MKTKSDKWQVTSDQDSCAMRDGAATARHSSLITHHWQQGMALVITLIMLSVTLVMVVAFFAVAKRERNAVSTNTDTATAQQAVVSALNVAQAQIAASVLAAGSATSFGLLVSTNYVNANSADPYYNTYFDAFGNFLPVNLLEQNIANQRVLPRAPVFPVINTATGQRDFRFYLDLNRNGRFEPNGAAADFEYVNGLLTNIGTNNQVGDPEWIGITEHPDQPHGPNNRFIARIAFGALPVGDSLDLNYIHNQTYNTGLGANDGFFRNENVGSWELNLAAFLADLNTNVWLPTLAPNNVFYAYNSPGGSANLGIAFDDARALLAWRYNYNYNNLAVPPGNMFNGWLNAAIDGLTLGNLMTTTVLPLPLGNNSVRWAGSENPNRFFSVPSDLFDPAKSSPLFVNRLTAASQGATTYDRDTFYRLLAQMGTDSSADDGKMNLNYDNTDANGNVVIGAETNLIPWTPGKFFTSAANRLLTNYTAQWLAQDYNDYTNTFGTISPFGIANIPVSVNGQFTYTPAVQRLLQLAANIYDASTNKTAALGRDFPSVFRPVFNKLVNGDVYITGYQYIPAIPGGLADPLLAAPFDVTGLLPGPSTDNVYGVPWIIGAKKGFPAFNQFYMRNLVQVTRKLQVTRARADIGALQSGNTASTNQMFLMSITNHLGFAFWNPYNANYVPASGSVTVYMRDVANMVLTNGVGTWPSFYANPPIAQFAFATNLSVWPGSAWTASGTDPTYQDAAPGSFITGAWDFAFLPESAYLYAGAFTSNPQFDYTVTTMPEFPQFGLLTTNRIQAVILDGTHLLDYVQLTGPTGTRNINSEIADTSRTGGGFWNTNAFGTGPTPTWGVRNQMSAVPSSQHWRTPPGLPGYINTPALEQAYFRGFFVHIPVATINGVQQFNTNYSMQVPYTPTRFAWQSTVWQANDPLVHYLASDLNTQLRDTGIHTNDDLLATPITDPALNTVGVHYQPWGRNQQMSQVNGVDSGKYNLSYRDPLVWNADAWDFPTRQYPTLGWLGRVHRGTPWQTVYLKASDVLAQLDVVNRNLVYTGNNTWAQWTGDTQASFANNNFFDAKNSAPVQDRNLFDLFTTRFNDATVHGTLSVNQSQLAAWSAVFSGSLALTNTAANPTSYTPLTYTSVIIQPAGSAGAASPLGQIVSSINNARANYPQQTFTHIGDLLRAPALTENSPYLNWADAAQRQNGISDELYEWLPQQTLGLLRLSRTPRYVIYGYGQALRPAPGGTELSGPYFNLVTNYQVTAESALRAVIRVNQNITTNTNGIPTGTNYTTTVESYNLLPPN